MTEKEKYGQVIFEIIWFLGWGIGCLICCINNNMYCVFCAVQTLIGYHDLHRKMENLK